MSIDLTAPEFRSCIIFRNEALDVFVLDLPQSFANAQSGGSVSDNIALAAAPPLEPWSSIEPCQPDENSSNGPQSGDVVQANKLLQALELARESLGETWCLPRQQWDQNTLKLKMARDRDNMEVAMAQPHSWTAIDPLFLSPGKSFAENLRKLQGRLICNDNSRFTTLWIRDSDDYYLIPESSHFLLTRITENVTPGFSMSAFQSVPAGQFDFILLDPPWQNRSVKRSRQYQMYDTSNDPLQALTPLMAMHMTPGAFVACWVTNKSSVREAALKLFAAWGVVLCEQWVWLKIAVNGRPVTELNGTWRKPYELLLIGCPQTNERAVTAKLGNVISRVLIAVPDLHSRKPSLKELVELLLIPKAKAYSALEVFARHLTAGWFACFVWRGDEVLKFNDAKAWGMAH